MAKAPDFSVGTTDLGKSNFQGYVKQGVVDKSKAMEIEADATLVNNLGTLAMKGIKDYDKYKTLSGVAEAVDNVVTEQQERSYEGMSSSQEALESTEEELKGVYSKFGIDNTYPTLLNQQFQDESRGLQEDLAEKTDKLTAAKEQGIMDSDELKERLAKISREAIANNPAYAAEIAAHVGNVAELNNITARVKKDEKLQTAMQDNQEANFKKLRDTAMKHFNIYDPEYQLPDGGFNYALISEDLTERMQAKEQSDLLDRAVKNNEAVLKINSQQFISQGIHFDVENNRVLSLDTDMITIRNGDATVKEKLEALAKKANDSKANYVRGLAQHNIDMQDPNIQQSIQRFNSRADRITELYSEIITGETDSSISGNEVSIIENQIKLMTSKRKKEIYTKNPDMLDLEITGEALRNILPSLNTRAAFDIKNKLSERAEKALLIPPPIYTEPESGESVKDIYETIPGTKQSTSAQIMETLYLKAIDNNSEAAQKLSQQYNNLVNFYNNGSPSGNASAVRTLTQFLTNPKANKAVELLDDMQVQQGSKMVQEFSEQYLSNRFKTLQAQYGNFDLTARESDGRLVVNGLNPKDMATFSAKEFKNFNDALKTYHLLSGNTDKLQSANTFLNFVKGVPTEKK